MSNSLYAIQRVRRLRGGSQAQLMRASDGQYWVVKFQCNPQGTRVLANEMFAGRLGRLFGLQMPQAEVIKVSEALIRNTPELRFDLASTRISCKPGRHLASLYEGDIEDIVLDYLPENLLSRVSNVSAFSNCLVLDKWTCNSDSRQAVFTKKPQGRAYYATLVDQRHCFNADEWNFPDSPSRGVYARTAVYAGVTGWDSFEPVLTMAEQADPTDLWRCAEAIPREWYAHDKAALERLVDRLYQRRTKIRDLITTVRNSPRNPFPNWSVSEHFSAGRLDDCAPAQTL